MCVCVCVCVCVCMCIVCVVGEGLERNVKLTFLVGKIDMRGFPNQYASLDIEVSMCFHVPNRNI